MATDGDDRFRESPSSLVAPPSTQRVRIVERLTTAAVALLVLAVAGSFVLGSNVEHRVLTGQPELCAHKAPLEVKGRVFQVCPPTADQARWAKWTFLSIWAAGVLSLAGGYVAQKSGRRRRSRAGDGL